MDSSSPRSKTHRPAPRGERSKPTSPSKREHKVMSILRFALFSVWLASTLLSFVLDVVADVFQADTPAFPLVPVMGTDIGLQVIATAVTVLYGCVTISDYRFFQPFAGGETFVILQFAGFCLAVIVAVVKVLLVEVHPHVPDTQRRRAANETILLPRTPYGAFTTLGVFTVLSQALLMTSHRYFKHQLGTASPSTSVHAAPARSWKTSLSQMPYRDYLLLLVCDAVVCASSAVAVCQPTFRPINVPVLFTFNTVVVLLLQLSTAPSIAPSYRLFQPFTAGAPYRLVALQCTADALLCVFYAGLIVLFREGSVAPPSWHTWCALMGMMATTIHAVLLRLLQFVWQNARVDEEAITAVPAALSPEDNLARMADIDEVALSGPTSVFSGASVTLGLLIFGVHALLDLSVPQSAQAEHGWRLLIQFVLIVLFMLPPLTFLQGSFLYGKRFSLWRSHRGSLDYLAAQVGGWWCYGAAFFSAVLQLTQAEMSQSLALLATACLVFSQLLIHSALYLFADQNTTDGAESVDALNAVSAAANAQSHAADADVAPRGPSSSPSLRPPSLSTPSTKETTEEQTPLSRVLNVEMVVAATVALVALLLRLVYDMVVLFAPSASALSDHARAAAGGAPVRSLFNQRGGRFYFMSDIDMASFLSVSRWLSLLAPVLAHLSMRDRVPLLHGFSLANGYVALQTLGWVLYMAFAANAVTQSVVGVPIVELPWHRTGNAAAAGWTFRLANRNVHLKSTETAFGLLYSLPFLFIFQSILVEAAFDAARSRIQQQAAKSADELLSVIHKHESSEEVLQACEDHVYLIAGNRLTDRRDVSTSASPGTYVKTVARMREDEAEKAAVADAAHYTTVLTSFAAVTASVFAFIASDSQPNMALLLCTASVLVGAFSCATLQNGYGPRFHRRSGGFSYFMPFAGGRQFVLRQIGGWMSLAVCVSVVIACYLEMRVSQMAIVVLTVTNLLSQWIICESIPHFNPAALKDFTGTVVGTYAEAILAIITLVATFFFMTFYSLATEKRATSQMTSLVPLVFSAIAMSLVIPFGLLSLQRQSVAYGLPNPLHYVSAARKAAPPERSLSRLAGSSSRIDLSNTGSGDEDEDEDDIDYDGSSSDDDAAEVSTFSHPHPDTVRSRRGSDSRLSDDMTHDTVAATPLLERWTSSVGPWDVRGASQPGSPMAMPGSPATTRRLQRRQRRARQNVLWIRAAYVLTGVLAVFVALLIPFGVGFVAYAYAYSAVPTLEAAVWVVQALSLVFGTLIVLPILFKSIVSRSRLVRNIHSAVCSFTIYSIPTITVVGGVAPGPVLRTRGAWLFTTNMVLLAIFSTLPHVLVTSFIFIVSSFGYFMHYHLYECLYTHRHPFQAGQCLSDIAMACFWLWYSRRYLGRPHVTGRLQNSTVSRFFRRYFFEGMSYYFSLRIIRSDPFVLPMEESELASQKSQLPHVDLNDPANQYIFSFHPHGVFPGSALFVPKTSLWEKTVGHNDKNFISTHCADVVFSVPLMREFPLNLGAMSVSRRGIENSLKLGNSPLIVTGGQSEMLLTRMSDTEMHLVCHHLGFIKIALHNKVPLVPLLSFSESNILDNVHCVRVQRWFLKRIGFPFPTFPRGRWGLPLPTSKPLTVVVGQPIYPLPGRDDPNDASCLDEMRTRYFEHLEVLFYKYRAAAGYPEMKLYLHNGVYNEGVLAVPPGVPSAGVDGQEDKDEEPLLTRQNSAVRRAMAVPTHRRKDREAKEPTPPSASSAAKKAQ